MGVFSSIMDKIFHHKRAGAQGAPAPAPATAAPAPAQAAAAAPTPMAAVDVDAVLTMMAEDKGGGGNWRTEHLAGARATAPASSVPDPPAA